MAELPGPKITYMIAEYGGRPWWRRRWEAHLTISGFPGSLANRVERIHTRHWTQSGAKRTVEREAAQRDFKIAEHGTMVHYE